MPFVVQKDLEDALNPAAVDRAMHRITDAVGDRLKANIQKHTPIGKQPGSRKHPRVPGTLHDSIRRTPVQRVSKSLGSGKEVRVFTEDPIAPDVEYTTKPHDIPNAFGFGDDFGIGGPFGGHFHPGTQGHHMFAIGALDTRFQVDEVARDPMRLFDRELTSFDVPDAL